jgi:enolase-phosphatase E1
MTHPVTALLLDVEGTTSSIGYVYDVLFPFARTETPAFLAETWDDPDTAGAVAQIAAEAGWPPDWAAGLDRSAAVVRVVAEVNRLMDADSKAGGLKRLQGLVWRVGYGAGKLRSHVFPDVPVALRRWAAAGRDVRIYSSGSVTAQKVFFAHTEAGDLTAHLRGHYDTAVGPKREARSYAAITADMARPPAEILFLSDVVAELDAARSAGLQTALVIRPGNAPVAPGHGHREVRDFDGLP